MTAMPVAQQMAADDYLTQPNNGRRTQLVEGEVVLNEPKWLHQRIFRRLHGQVSDEEPSSPCPDLAIEIRSPSTWRYEIGAKKAGYERSGLRELWLVDTAADEVLVVGRSRTGAQTFDVSLELTREDTLTSPLLPGFELPLSSLS